MIFTTLAICGDTAFAIKEFNTNVKTSEKLACIKTFHEKNQWERKIEVAKFD